MLKVRVIVAMVLTVLAPPLTEAQYPLRVEKLYEQGMEKLDEEQYEQALALFTECIHEWPQYAEAYAGRAQVRERLQDLSGAMIDYAISVEILPDQYDPLFSLAVIRYELKLYDLAKLDFLKLLQLPSGETRRIMYRMPDRGSTADKITTVQSGIRSELYNYLGLIETRLKNCKRGITYLDSAIQLSKEANYYANRAMAKKVCHDPTAEEDSKRALAINPDHPVTKHNMTVETTSYSAEEVEKQLTDIILSDSSIQYPFVARAYFRLTNGKYQGAVQDYTSALRMNAQDPQLWLYRGMAKERLNDLAGAFRDYTQAIELKETFANAWVNRANVLMKQNRFQDAIDDFTIAILHQPDYGYAYVNRALAKHYGKASTDACADLLQGESLGVTIDPSVKKEICPK